MIKIVIRSKPARQISVVVNNGSPINMLVEDRLVLTGGDGVKWYLYNTPPANIHYSRSWREMLKYLVETVRVRSWIEWEQR